MRALLLSILVLFSSAASAIELEGSTDALEVVTSSTAQIDYSIKWANRTATALTTPGTSSGAITTATTTTVIAQPSASNWRLVTSLILRNISTTASNIVTVQVDRSATNREVYEATLAPSESLAYDGSAWRVYSSSGMERSLRTETSGFTGKTFLFGKVATAVDTIGYHYAYLKDVGFPGVWAPGTPGLNGDAISCDTAADAVIGGTFVLPDPTGAWYLTNFGLTAAVVGNYELIDVLWFNTGLAVTTTTAQNITFPGLPARDLNGSANGEGVYAALLTTTANTNAGAISNTTISYTDQDGNAGAVGTFSAVAGFQAPITPSLGTWMPFNLAAGDRGIRSVQSVTLGTSYGAGALSLVLYRPIAQTGVSIANTSSGSLNGFQQTNPGVRIYNDTCFALTAIGAPAVTAPGIYGGVINLMDR